jgi:predicted phage-related endonuclease
MYEQEEVLRELDKFKLDALQRLIKLEMKVNELDACDEDIKQDIHELKQTILSETNDLHNKVEYIRQEMPSAATNKIMFAVFGATLSFLFAMILLYVR